MAFQNLVKLKSLRDKKWKYLEKGQDEIVLYFFLAEMFALEWQSGAKKLNSVVTLITTAIFDGKVSTASSYPLRTCFQIMGSH